MDKKDCAGLFAALEFDLPSTMNCDLAKNYFEEHEGTFSVFEDGQDTRSENDYEVEIELDNLNNEIHVSDHYKAQHVEEWADASATRKTIILNKIAALIEAKTDLMIQLEYCLRGIEPKQTKHYVKLLTEYFRYYSNLIHIQHSMDPANLGGLLVSMNNTTPLIYFGMVTSAAIAAGRSLSIMVTNNSAAIGILLGEICFEAGLPPGVLNVFSTTQRFINNLESLEKPKRIFLPSKISLGSVMTIFESSDVDSAVDTIIEAAWSNNGFLPWALKRILVQESVYEEFIQKLSGVISKFKWSLPDDYKPNCTMEQMIAKVDEVLSHASDHGIRYVQMHESFNESADQKMFKPLILLDNVAPYFWQEIKNDEYPVPVVTVQAFRTTKEAISLINSLPSYGLSLWCDSVSISNEVSHSANVNSVWVNSFGYLKPDIPIKEKSKPFNSYGGKQGLFWQMTPAMRYDSTSLEIEKRSISTVISNSASFEVCMDKATKLQFNWAQCYKDRRVGILTRTALFLEKMRKEYISLQKEEFEGSEECFTDIFNEAINYLFFAISICESSKDEFIIRNDKKININTLQPVGVIAIQDQLNSINHFTYSVVAAVIFGNAVIYTTNSKLISQACSDFLVNGLPVVAYGGSSIPNESMFDNLHGCWTLYHLIFDPEWNEKTLLKSWVQHLKNFVTNKDLLEMYFCDRKTIWNTYGETFAN